MKKPAALCIIFLAAGLSFGQEASVIDFATSLNNSIHKSDFFNNIHNNKNDLILFLPSLYFNRKHQIYATFGFIVPQARGNSEFNEENMPNTLINAAFFLRYRKTNIILFLEYFRDDSWGLSIKLRF